MADQTFAVNCGFFDAIDSDRVYSADEMNRPYRRIISNGVFATPQGDPSTDLQVVESTGMNIICKAGEGLFGDKWFENPSSIVITVPNNTATVPRIDSVLVQVDTRTSGRVGNIVYRTGTPASSPVPPAINQTEGVVEYRLANIRVNAGVTSIQGRYITDRRGSSDCPWVTSLIYQVDTSTLYDQWQAAYEEYFEAEKAIWDAWYAQLTEDLDVSMTLDRHTNTVTTTATTTGTIPIGLAYNHNTDILEVYINGLRAVEGTHYIVVDGDTSIQVENQLQIGQTVTFVVMRSVISGSATNIMVLLQELESQIAGVAGGTPTVVDDASDMTDTEKIYILSSDSKWYYYSATQEDWVTGGTYGGVPTDTTLTQAGRAADAKTVGDNLDALDDRVTAVEGDLGQQIPIWIDGYAIQSTSGSPVVAEDHSYATFSVTEGCVVKGYTRGGAGASRGCAFYDADGVYISGEYNSVESTYDWNYEIAVPDGARTFKITCNTSYKSSFSFSLRDITNGLLKVREQIDINTYNLSRVFSNYTKISIIEGVLYSSISSSSVGAESTAKNQISFYFPVEAGKIYTVDKKITTALTRIAYSENEPTYLTPVSNYENLGATGTHKTFTAPIDGYAIIYVYNRTNDGDDKFDPILYNTVAYEYAYVPEVEQDSVELTSVVNSPHILYCGSGRKYTKLTDAIVAAEKYMDSVLYVDAGTYDLVSEFGSEFFESLTASSTLAGIVLKNRIHIIFSPNSKVVSHYAGSNQYALSLYSPFNAGPYGFTLENLTLECSRCRYAVHDERNGNVEQYKSEYINCSMQIDNSNNPQWSPRHCIGGGLGSNAEIVINTCNFKTDLSSDRGGVYYHQSNASGNTSYKSLVAIKNSFFETGTITFSDSRTDSTADKTIYIATNNCFSQKYAGTDAQGIYTADITNPNSVVRAWNNAIVGT